MSAEDRIEIKLVLSCKDDKERNRLHQSFSATAGASPERTPQAATPDLLVLEVRKAPTRLGAFETAFLLGMTLSVAVSATGVGAWCIAHHRRGGGPISLDFEEGRAIMAAATPARDATLESRAPAADQQAANQT